MAAKLLLVDDEPFNLDLLEQELDAAGYQIETASNGQQALDQIEADPPDMIFLDLMMPVLDGFAVLERLAAHERWRSIPVVIISAADDMQSIARGIELGADDFLPKPFEPAILHARLKAGLAKKRIADLEQRHLDSLEHELEIGRQIQAGFLPTEIPQPTGWGISSYFKAAREVAGDFYDVFQPEPDKLCLLLGDVTDKGVGSALYMALYLSLLKATLLASQFEELSDGKANSISKEAPKSAVQLVNRYICRFHDSAMLATIFLGILDLNSGALIYVNAGQDPPFLLNGRGQSRPVEPTGPVVGAIEEAEFRLERLTLEPGSSLVLYSDGVPDARNKRGDMYGSQRLLETLLSPADKAADLSANVLLSLREFVGEAEPYDDISLLVVRRSS